MFDSLIDWLCNAILDLCEGVTNLFLDCLDFNMNDFLDSFPVAATLYEILQGVAIGIIVCFAAWNLIKFFVGNSKLNETPVQLLIHTAIAAALVYFGNNFLQIVMNLCAYPYKEMVEVSAVDLWGWENISDFLLDESSTSIGSSGLLNIICLIILGWQVTKLFFEMVERWVVLGVIVYTSPLAWATAVSVNSRQILFKWLNLFFSSCIMLLFNVWSVKMLFSVMTAMDGFITIVLALSLVKVARKIDSILAQIGMNPVQTGRSILDDMLGMAKSIGNMARHHQLVSSRNGGSALGSAAHMSRTRSAADTIAARRSMGEAAGKDAKKALLDGAKKGEVFVDNKTGKPITGKQAEQMGKDWIATGQVPDGVTMIDYNDPQKFSNRDIAQASMTSQAVSVNNQDKNNPVLEGNDEDVAKVLSSVGNEMAASPEMNQAAANTAGKLTGDQMEQVIDDAAGLNNQSITQAMMQNAATNAGMEEQLGEERVRGVQDAASKMDGEAGQAMLMSQLGTADPNATYGDAMDAYNNLDDKFGRNAEGNNYDLLNEGSRPAPENLTAKDLSAEGRAKAQSQAFDNYQQYKADADMHRERAAEASASLQQLAQNGTTSGAEVDNLKNQIENHNKQAQALDAKAESFAEKNFGTKTPTAETALSPNAPITGDVQWSDLGQKSKKAELGNIQQQYNDKMAQGDYQGAAELAMEKTASLDPNTLTPKDMDNRTVADGHKAIDNMATSEKNAGVSFSDVTVDNGTMSGNMHSKMFDPATGKMEDVTTPTTFKTEQGMAGVPNKEKGDYTETKVGAKTFYANTGTHINDRTNAPVAIPPEGSGRAHTSGGSATSGSGTIIGAAGGAAAGAAAAGTMTPTTTEKTDMPSATTNAPASSHTPESTTSAPSGAAPAGGSGQSVETVGGGSGSATPVSQIPSGGESGTIQTPGGSFVMAGVGSSAVENTPVETEVKPETSASMPVPNIETSGETIYSETPVATSGGAGSKSFDSSAPGGDTESTIQTPGGSFVMAGGGSSAVVESSAGTDSSPAAPSTTPASGDTPHYETPVAVSGGQGSVQPNESFSGGQSGTAIETPGGSFVMAGSGTAVVNDSVSEPERISTDQVSFSAPAPVYSGGSAPTVQESSSNITPDSSVINTSGGSYVSNPGSTVVQHEQTPSAPEVLQSASSGVHESSAPSQPPAEFTPSYQAPVVEQPRPVQTNDSGSPITVSGTSYSVGSGTQIVSDTTPTPKAAESVVETKTVVQQIQSNGSGTVTAPVESSTYYVESTPSTPAQETTGFGTRENSIQIDTPSSGTYYKVFGGSGPINEQKEDAPTWKADTDGRTTLGKKTPNKKKKGKKKR